MSLGKRRIDNRLKYNIQSGQTREREKEISNQTWWRIILFLVNKTKASTK